MNNIVARWVNFSRVRLRRNGRSEIRKIKWNDFRSWCNLATASVCFTYVCRCFLSSARLQVLLAACLLDLCVAKEKKKIELLSARCGDREVKSGNRAAAARQVFYTFEKSNNDEESFCGFCLVSRSIAEAPTPVGAFRSVRISLAGS